MERGVIDWVMDFIVTLGLIDVYYCIMYVLGINYKGWYNNVT